MINEKEYIKKSYIVMTLIFILAVIITTVPFIVLIPKNYMLEMGYLSIWMSYNFGGEIASLKTAILVLLILTSNIYNSVTGLNGFLSIIIPLLLGVFIGIVLGYQFAILKKEIKEKLSKKASFTKFEVLSNKNNCGNRFIYW